MLEEYQKFILIDKAGKNKFFLEVNWDPENKEINKCKIIKITCPDGKEAYIDKANLFSILWIIGAPSEQRKMIPQKVLAVRHYKTNLFAKLRQDMKTGEILKIPVTITLPAVAEEIITEIKKDQRLAKALIKDAQTLAPPLIVPEKLERSAKPLKEK